MGQGIACSSQQILRFPKVQFQGHSKSNSRAFAGCVAFTGSDFGKQLSVKVGALINFHIRLAFGVNQSQERLGKGFIKITN